ncbi:unnamed protein product, partial [Linum tenue]
EDRALSWLQRIEIAIDCARGLWLLHTYPGRSIVHRNIKACPYFGSLYSSSSFQLISKVINLGHSFVSSEVRGTFSYVDPEYQRNHHVNAKGDVYNFGIVLMQILSGQKLINMNHNTRMKEDFLQAYIAVTGNLSEFGDPKLNGEYSTEAFEILFKLALSCSGCKQDRQGGNKIGESAKHLNEIVELTKHHHI